MNEVLKRFEAIVRHSYSYTAARDEPSGGLHPFDERNVHESLRPVSKALFDDGHFAQATFEAYKFVDKIVQRISGNSESGVKLMMQAFSHTSPQVQLNKLVSTSDQDEQKGYQFLFAGAVMAVRNRRGHDVGVPDGPDVCLDHLSLASFLLRRIEEAGFEFENT